MKRKSVVLIVCLLILSITGCGNKAADGSNEADGNKVSGTWEFYGVIRDSEENYSEDDYSIKDALVGDDFVKAYGLEQMPDNEITVTEAGVKEMYENNEGTDLDSIEMSSDSKMCQRLKITVLDGKELDEPLYSDINFTVADGYLFVKQTFSDSQYSGGDVSVYKRK